MNELAMTVHTLTISEVEKIGREWNKRHLTPAHKDLARFMNETRLEYDPRTSRDTPVRVSLTPRRAAMLELFWDVQDYLLQQDAKTNT